MNPEWHWTSSDNWIQIIIEKKNGLMVKIQINVYSAHRKWQLSKRAMHTEVDFITYRRAVAFIKKTVKY